MTKALIGYGLLCFLAACSDGKGSSNHSAYLDQDARDLAADGLSKRPSQEFLAARKDVEGSLPPAEKSYASHYNLAQSDGEKIAKDKALKKPRRSVAKGLKLEIDEVKEEDADTAGEALAETLAALREVDEDAESCADLDDEERILNCAVAWLLLEVQRSRKEAADAGKPAPVKDAGGEADTGSDEPMDAGVDANSDGGKTDAGKTDASLVDAGKEAGNAEASTPPEAGTLCDLATNQLKAFLPSNLPADFVLPATAPVMKGGNDLDTDALSVYYKITDLAPVAVKQADGSEAALFVVQRFELGMGQTLKVTGQRPLILVALDDIVVGGQIVTGASGTNGYGSAGAPGPSVPERKGFGLGGGSAGTINKAAGGGASFCGQGGRASGQTTDSIPYGTPQLVPLVGGSSGGVATNAGGLAGGAVQLVAGKSITVTETGLVNMTAAASPGWAGGSSGGAILLEAPKVTVAGTLSANSSGGSSYYSGEKGTVTVNPANGGIYGNSSPSRGGSGSAAEKINGDNGAMVEAAAFAGGGGGAGRIRINTGCGTFTPGANALITPSITTVCYSEGTLAPR